MEEAFEKLRTLWNGAEAALDAGTKPGDAKSKPKPPFESKFKQPPASKSKPKFTFQLKPKSKSKSKSKPKPKPKPKPKSNSSEVEAGTLDAIVQGTKGWFEAQFGQVLEGSQESTSTSQSQSPNPNPNPNPNLSPLVTSHGLTVEHSASSSGKRRHRRHTQEGSQVISRGARNKEISRDAGLVEGSAHGTRTERRRDKELTLLVLGTSGSGKSTLVHQIDYKYSFTSGTVHPREWAGHVRRHILLNMQRALQELSVKGVDFGETTQMKDDFVKAYANPRPDQVNTLPPMVARNLKRLWHDPAVQSNLDLVSKGVHLEFMDEFIADLDRVSSAAYVPTFQDILHSHVRTTGVWDHKLEFNGYDTVIRDVGGVRSERRKWPYLFEGVDAVIFVAAVGEFDQMLYEDHEQNSLDESLDLFKDLVQGQGVFKGVLAEDVPVFLVLNKTDVLLDKLEQTDKLAGRQKTSLLLTYDGPNIDDGVSKDAVFEYVSEHIKHQFLRYNKDTNKHVYPFFLNATDEAQFVEMFNAIMDILINEEY